MAVAATGFFDGVHLGHKQVIDRLCAVARERGEESLLVTFWPHPRSVLQQDADRLRLLSTLQEKRARCLAYGVDRFEVLPFDRDFSQLSAESFIKEYLSGRLGVTALVLGYDHRLGHDAFASTAEMMETVARCGVTPVRVEAFSRGLDVVISSTQIRRALFAGDVTLAERMLGYCYGLHGVVVAGNRIGRTIGFPTANMQLYEPLKLIPGRGIYETEVETLGCQFKGMTNIGVRPTVGKGNALTVETNIFDFDEEIYGRDITVRFVRKIRDEIPFPSLEALSAQLAIDRTSIILK